MEWSPPIESGSERMIKAIHKDITMDMVMKAVDLLDKHGLKYEAFFMIGFPDETREDMEKTFGLMKSLKNGSVCFSIFTPYPGTEQYDIAKSHGLIPNSPDWSRFSHQSNENHFMKNMKKDEFRSYVEEI